MEVLTHFGHALERSDEKPGYGIHSIMAYDFCNGYAHCRQLWDYDIDALHDNYGVRDDERLYWNSTTDNVQWSDPEQLGSEVPVGAPGAVAGYLSDATWYELVAWPQLTGDRFHNAEFNALDQATTKDILDSWSSAQALRGPSATYIPETDTMVLAWSDFSDYRRIWIATSTNGFDDYSLQVVYFSDYGNYYFPATRHTPAVVWDPKTERVYLMWIHSDYDCPRAEWDNPGCVLYIDQYQTEWPLFDGEVLVISSPDATTGSWSNLELYSDYLVSGDGASMACEDSQRTRNCAFAYVYDGSYQRVVVGTIGFDDFGTIVDYDFPQRTPQNDYSVAPPVVAYNSNGFVLNWRGFGNSAFGKLWYYTFILRGEGSVYWQTRGYKLNYTPHRPSLMSEYWGQASNTMHMVWTY